MKKKNPKKDGKRQKAAVKRSLRERARKQGSKAQNRKPAVFAVNPTAPKDTPSS